MENNDNLVLGKVIDALLGQKAIKATYYLSPKLIIRAVRKTYKNGTAKRHILRSANTEVMLTIGKPNYREREFIKELRKAGEPFPVKKIQLKF